MIKYSFTKKDRRNGAIQNCGYMTYDQAGDNSAELYFYGDICGASWSSEWFTEDKAPQDVVDFINELNSGSTDNKKLDVYINSGGGDVFGGLAIYNILKRYSGEKIAHIDGIAASIAGIIPFSCDKVIASSSSQIMLHKPWTGCVGNANDMKKCIESLNTCEQSIIDIYAEHAINGVTAEKIKSMIDRETWLTCGEAADYFNIEIVESEPIAACISDMYKIYANTPDSLKNQNHNKENDTDEIRKRKLKMSLDLYSFLR